MFREATRSLILLIPSYCGRILAFGVPEGPGKRGYCRRENDPKPYLGKRTNQELTLWQPKERDDANSFRPRPKIKEQRNRFASIEYQKNGDVQARDTKDNRKTRHCDGRARPFLLANSHGFGRGVVRLCPNACRPSVWGKLGNSLGLGGFRTRHVRSDSDDPKARGTT